MKKILLFIFCSLSFLYSKGQLAYQYVTFLDSRSVWSVSHDCTYYDSPQGNHNYNRIGHYMLGVAHDSTLPSIYEYHILTQKTISYDDYFTHQVHIDSSLIGYVREDTSARKIYFRDKTGAEKLLYDFSKNVGDSLDFIYCQSCDIFQLDLYHVHKAIIQKIDTVPYNGILRKRFIYYFADSVGSKVADSSQTYRIIEGIGSTAGLLNPLAAFPRHPDACWLQLTCFSKGDTSIYPSLSAGQCPVALPQYIGIVDVKNNIASLYPNPTASTISIKLLELQEDNEFILHDFLGRQIFKSKIDHTETTHDISSLPSGLYTWRITSDNTILKTGKIVKQ